MLEESDRQALRSLIKRAKEPPPKPHEQEGHTRAAEAALGRADDEARREWQARVDQARRELLDELERLFP